ncbi:hypothetical protein JCM10449v2_004631 [Rhodotorula kratochvilovae]
MDFRRHLRRLKPAFCWSGRNRENPAVHPQVREMEERGPNKPPLSSNPFEPEEDELPPPVRTPIQRPPPAITVDKAGEPVTDSEWSDDEGPTGKDTPPYLDVAPASPFQPRFSTIYGEALTRQQEREKRNQRVSRAPTTRTAGTNRTSWTSRTSMSPSVRSHLQAPVVEAHQVPLRFFKSSTVDALTGKRVTPVISGGSTRRQVPRRGTEGLDKSLPPPPPPPSRNRREPYASIDTEMNRI